MGLELSKGPRRGSRSWHHFFVPRWGSFSVEVLHRASTVQAELVPGHQATSTATARNRSSSWG